MRQTGIALLILLALAAMTATAEAKRGFGMPGGFPGSGFGNPEMMLERMADRLDLSDEQYQQVSNIMQAAQPEFEALREQMKANREALASIDLNDTADAALLNDVAASNGRLATEGTLLFARVRSEVNAVLTEEQRAKLARGKERMRERAEQRMRNE